MGISIASIAINLAALLELSSRLKLWILQHDFDFNFRCSEGF